MNMFIFELIIDPKIISQHDIIKELKSRLKKIIQKNDTLIIIDSYLFSDEKNLVVDILSDFINELKEIKFIVSKKYTKTTIYNEIVQTLQKNNSLKIGLHYSEEIHDRFWLSSISDAGFTIGTSSNGFTTKTHRISDLEKQEVIDIKFKINGI